MSDLKSLYVDENETDVAVLGSSYLQNVLANGLLGKGICAVSDKRVYFKGKCFVRTGVSYKSATEERIVDLKDVTGTGYVVIKNPTFLILMILTMVVLVVGFFYGMSVGALEDTVATFIIGLILMCIFLIGHVRSRKRVFEIAFAGGQIAFDTAFYKKEELVNFQKALHLAKEKDR